MSDLDSTSTGRQKGRVDTTDGARARVLIVEDEYLVAETYRYAVEVLGHEVVGPSPSVGAALDILERERVDVALLDVLLRGKVVVPVARRLRELGIPFLFLTGSSDLSALDGDFGEVAVLGKPTPAGALALAIRAELAGE